jgi:hypothetical protein
MHGQESPHLSAVVVDAQQHTNVLLLLDADGYMQPLFYACFVKETAKGKEVEAA